MKHLILLLSLIAIISCDQEKITEKESTDTIVVDSTSNVIDPDIGGWGDGGKGETDLEEK